MYVRQRPDDSRRAIVQYSLIDQRRIPCTSVAAFLEPFWFFFSLFGSYAECDRLA
jgi:hypothetical protein